jgi:hypothetical protein
MKQRTVALMIGVCAAPFFVGLPVAVIFLFPSYVLWALKISLLAPIALLIYFCLPNTSTIVKAGTIKRLPSWLWLTSIFGIQILSMMLFFGQLISIGQYKVSNHLLVLSSFNSWSLANTYYLCVNWGLFPWAFIALAAVLFYRGFHKSNQPYSLAAQLPIPNTVFFKRVRRVFDICVFSATRCFIAFCIGFCAIQIALIIYPSLSSLFIPIVGLVTCALMLVVMNLQAVIRFAKRAEDLRVAPIKTLSLYLVVFIILIILLSFLSKHYFLKHNLEGIIAWKTLNLLPGQSLLTTDQLYFFAWWIVATPLLSSLISYLSTGRSLRQIILATLFLPALALILFQYFKTPIGQHWQINATVIDIIQIISLLFLLLLFKKSSSNQLLWLGFTPARPMKKLRAINLKLLWTIGASLMGMFALAGQQGLIIVGALSTLPILLMYCLLIWRS